MILARKPGAKWKIPYSPQSKKGPERQGDLDEEVVERGEEDENSVLEQKLSPVNSLSLFSSAGTFLVLERALKRERKSSRTGRRQVKRGRREGTALAHEGGKKKKKMRRGVSFFFFFAANEEKFSLSLFSLLRRRGEEQLFLFHFKYKTFSLGEREKHTTTMRGDKLSTTKQETKGVAASPFANSSMSGDTAASAAASSSSSPFPPSALKLSVSGRLSRSFS